MQIAKAGLFGGTLLAAGISSAANGQEFVILDNLPGYADHFVNAFVYDYYALSYDPIGGQITDAGFGSSYNVAYAQGSASSLFDTNILSAEAEAINNTDFLGFASASSYGYLSVTEDGRLDLAWDFTQSQALLGPGANIIQVIDWSANGGAGALLFSSGDVGDSGTASVDLFAGSNYGILVQVRADQFGQSSGSATLVPTPGAIGLLAVAGLGATRRRR